MEQAAFPSVAERLAAGKAQRDACPRKTHAQAGTFDRDPVELIKASSVGRLERLIPLRYGRMLANPFAFYRGTALLQAHDLASAPSSGLVVQACGDCHLANFGGFATPERQLAFDINDFDETAPAPFEWDLKRLVASFEVATRHLRLPAGAGEEAIRCAVESYVSHALEYAHESALEVWYDHITFERLLRTAGKRAAERLEVSIERAQKRGHEELLPKMGDKVDGRWVLRDNLPTVFHLNGPNTLAQEGEVVLLGMAHARALLHGDYGSTLSQDRLALLRRHELQDVAMKVVGVGSVGTRCFVLLLVDGEDHPLFLQVKETNPSVLQGRSPVAGPVPHEGRRVVEGQRLMQASSDLFLGWFTGATGRGYYVRQLRDMKVSPSIETFDAGLIADYAKICGWVLARAHAKGSGRAAELAGYAGSGGKLADALVAYSTAYADQVEKDYDRFAAACRQGVLPITTEEAFQQDLVA